MKIYSLYLSTQTGATTQAIFTGVAVGTNLYVTSVTSGTLATYQYITINGVINRITAFVAGSGTNGKEGIYTFSTTVTILSNAGVSARINNTNYILDNLTAPYTGTLQVGQVITGTGNNIMTYITNISGTSYYVNNTTVVSQRALLFYNTSTFQSVTYNNGNNIKYTPSFINNSLNSAKWFINWREIFQNRIGEARLRARFISNSSPSLSWVSNIGSIRATLQSTSSNCSNGFNIGSVRPQSDYTSGTTGVTYLDCDTTQTLGSTMIIPNSSYELNIILLDKTEQPMQNVPDYQLWLYFDCDDEDDTSNKNMFSPR